MNIENLNLPQKIGQLVMPRIDFSDPESLSRARKLVQEFEVGGFIIFNGMRDVVTDTTQELQSLSSIPLLFGCDAERGVGQIVRDMTLFPFTMSLGAAHNESLVYDQASFIAQEMKACGLNLLFAPVADVNSNPNNPIINIRSYSDDPNLVSQLCAAFIRGCQENGVLACAKHFPGHGRTGVDSHIDLPVMDTDLDTLEGNDLIPFEKSIEAGLASIMTAHIAFPEISDAGAVTVSKELISDLLRDRMGFDGLAITDSLHMEGIIKLGEEADTSRDALNAGCDIILDPLNPSELVPSLINLAGSDLSLSQLDSKVERIISTKEKFLNNHGSHNPINIETGTELNERIARDSVCIVRGSALKSKKALICNFDVTQSETDMSKPFSKRLVKNGIDLIEKEIDQISSDTTIICLVYTTIGAWKKQSLLPDNFKDALSKLESISAETVLVSFGSPYVISEFDNFDTVLCSFDILDVCQEAAADVLTGNLKATASMPVSLG